MQTQPQRPKHELGEWSSAVHEFTRELECRLNEWVLKRIGTSAKDDVEGVVERESASVGTRVDSDSAGLAVVEQRLKEHDALLVERRSQPLH